jgi:hypothetical protein
MSKKIKLFKIGEIEVDGKIIIRLQSQLSVGTDCATHIIEDGELKSWRYGKSDDEGEVDFYKDDSPYEIVENIEDMRRELL